MVAGLDAVLDVLANTLDILGLVHDDLEDRGATGGDLVSLRPGAPPLALKVVCGLGARSPSPSAILS
ncbi:MAG: hypothetical protein ABSG92_04650 [Conexivisphaerales archaeon]